MELHTIFRAFLPINVTLEMVSNVTLTWCVAASMALLSLIHLLDASHRIGSRSVELMQAWLYVRLIAYFQGFSKATGPFSSFRHTISMSS